MSLHDRDDDPYHDDYTLCPTRRREEAEKFSTAQMLRERFLLEAACFAADLAATNPRLIDRWDRSTRRDTLTEAEAIAGFLERVADCIADLIDHDELARAERIATTGSDE